MPLTSKNRWRESAEATAAAATATHAAESGKAHYVTHVSASHDGGAGTGVRADLKDGATTIMSWSIENMPLVVNFGSEPIQITEGNAVTMELASGGGGVLGIVNIAGYTADPA